MKKLLAIIATIGLSLSAYCQTDTNPPSTTLWDFITTGSNYWAVPYGTYSVGDHSFGGGIALGYRVTEIINPVFRLDYFGGNLYMPSLTAQLQPPRWLLGKIPVTPFGIAGGGTAIAGAGAKNGTFVTILGAGAYVKLSDIFPNSTAYFIKHGFVVGDYERWLGLPSKQESQVRGGFGITF